MTNRNASPFPAMGRRLAAEGIEAEAIVASLQDAGAGYSTARNVLAGLRREGLVACCAGVTREPLFEPASTRKERWLRDARAGQWHLIDLKRAGHSPRFTEIPIPADLGTPARISRPLAQISLYGSPPATASDFAW